MREGDDEDDADDDADDDEDRMMGIEEQTHSIDEGEG